MAKYFWITFTTVIFPVRFRNSMKNIWPCLRTCYLHAFQIKHGTVGDNYLITTNDYQVLTICYLSPQQMDSRPTSDFIFLTYNCSRISTLRREIIFPKKNYLFCLCYVLTCSHSKVTQLLFSLKIFVTLNSLCSKYYFGFCVKEIIWPPLRSHQGLICQLITIFSFEYSS